MKRITIDDVMSTSPCNPPYTREYVTELFDGKKYVYPLTILKDDRIPAEDKLWLLLRDGWLPDRIMHLAACDFAEAALLREREAGREPDERSWNAIKVKRDWLDGKATDEEYAAARDAARAGDWAGARYAARAWAGAWAWESDRTAQVKTLIDLLEETK